MTVRAELDHSQGHHPDFRERVAGELTNSETASGLSMTLVSSGLRLACCRVRCDCALDPPGEDGHS
jgi:hypothetical protein